MKPFIITYDKEWSKPKDKYWIFEVSQGDEQVPMAISLTEEVKLHHGQLSNEIFMRLGLKRIKEKLNKNNYGDLLKEYKKNSKHFPILINREDIPVDFIDLSKECKFQQQGKGGLYCEVSAEGVGEFYDGRTNRTANRNKITTSSMCNECIFPDDRIRCGLLTHPETEFFPEYSNGRELISVFCDEKGKIEDCSSCIPDGIECWQQIYELPRPVISIPIDLPERVADEIDFLNLYIKSTHKIKLIDLKFYRPISDMHGKCQTDKEFTALIQALGTILDRGQFKIVELLPQDKQTKKENGKDVELNSLEALKAFLQLNYSAAGSSIPETLRHIVQIRNSYPAHPKETTESFEALNIEHPIYDYQNAWGKILYAFYDSIKTLRKLIQDNQETV